MNEKLPKRSLFYLLIIIVFLCIENLVASGANGFIKVKGKHFELKGKRYAYLGANLWYGANLGALTDGGNRKRLIKELDYLQSIGITNLRVLGASEGGVQNNTVTPAIQEPVGQFNEAVLNGLDFLLSEMGKRKMYAVIFLNNFWVWSGGMSQYVSSFEKVPLPNPFLKQYGWDQFMNFSARFYSNTNANAAYRKYINFLINRKNTISHILYREDQTIMAWQLANEPRPGNSEQGEKNFRVFSRWIDQTSAYIKSIDHNHLVSTGNEGLAGCMGSARLYEEIHSYKNVDYMTFHLWILNWGWFNPMRARETYSGAASKALAYIKEHIGYADQVGKPVVLEEFGIPRDKHEFSPEAGTIYRDKFYNLVFKAVYKNAKSGGPLVGSNFWAWGGFGKIREEGRAIWKKGDDFTGDPPQEPQGRNSVFVDDSSSVKILRLFARQMSDLP